MPFGLGESLPDNKTMAPYKGLLDAEALPNVAGPVGFEGLSGARARRKVHTASRGNAYKNSGQGNDDGGTELVGTQVVNDQIPCHKAPKKQQPSGRQAAQETGNAASHPAYWGGRMRGQSRDDDSHDTPPAPAQKEDGLDNKDEDGPANGKDRAHDIVAAALAELAWEEGGLPALNIVRLDHGYDVRARALAALRDDKPGMPSEGSDQGNSFNNSNVDPDDPYT